MWGPLQPASRGDRDAVAFDDSWLLAAGLTLTHLIREWHLIVIAFLVGIVNAFDVPIRQFVFCDMVGEGDLPNRLSLIFDF